MGKGRWVDKKDVLAHMSFMIDDIKIGEIYFVDCVYPIYCDVYDCRGKKISFNRVDVIDNDPVVVISKRKRTSNNLLDHCLLFNLRLSAFIKIRPAYLKRKI